MNKKKVLIAYATYGSGHKTVAEYIYEYFKNNNSKEELDIRIIDVLDYSNKLGDLSKNLFEKNFQLKGNFIFNTVYEFFDHRITTIPYKFITRTLFAKDLEDYIIDFEPDIFNTDGNSQRFSDREQFIQRTFDRLELDFQRILGIRNFVSGMDGDGLNSH